MCRLENTVHLLALQGKQSKRVHERVQGDTELQATSAGQGPLSFTSRSSSHLQAWLTPYESRRCPYRADTAFIITGRKRARTRYTCKEEWQHRDCAVCSPCPVSSGLLVVIRKTPSSAPLPAPPTTRSFPALWNRGGQHQPPCSASLPRGRPAPAPPGSSVWVRSEPGVWRET